MTSETIDIATPRVLYPVFGFVGGSAACYPKQTYRVTSKTLTTTLPLVATAGKATVDGTVILQNCSTIF